MIILNMEKNYNTDSPNDPNCSSLLNQIDILKNYWTNFNLIKQFEAREG